MRRVGQRPAQPRAQRPEAVAASRARIGASAGRALVGTFSRQAIVDSARIARWPLREEFGTTRVMWRADGSGP